MSLLLIGLDEALMPALIARLIAQGDEVRVLEDDDEAADGWRALGAHIASGPRWDEDLIERAAQNVRTIVLGERHEQDPAELIAAVVVGGGFAARDMRIVMVADKANPEILRIVGDSGLDYVSLVVPSRRGLRGKRRVLAPDSLAEAVDAADDLAGSPKLELDLGDEPAWQELKLNPPTPP